MPSAKADFIQRIRCLNSSITSEAVTNKALSEIEHNSIAKMLRNGLAVVGFAALEDFIKKRSSEAMDEIGRTTVPFNSLPDKLQNAATYEVLSALTYQLSLLEKEDKAPYIQQQAMKIASTATTNYELPDHAFAHNQANVSHTAIGDILKSFNVDDPWKQISTIASSTGLTGLPLVESYRNAARRRHRAAHVAATDTPQNDIAQFVRESFAIAIGFDALLSKSIQKFRENDIDHIEGNNKIDSSNIGFRVIKFSDGFWKEFVNGNQRAFRRSTDLAVFKPQVKNRASSHKQLYLETDDQGLISDWECN